MSNEDIITSAEKRFWDLKKIFLSSGIIVLKRDISDVR